MRERLVKLVESRGSIDDRFVDIQGLDAVGGGGTFSLMFAATDTQTSQRVALKVLMPFGPDAYRQHCFRREERLLRDVGDQPDIIRWVAQRSSFQEQLEHPATGLSIPIDFEYFAMELARTDVRSVIALDAVDARTLLVLFRGACRGLQRLHSLSIAHRDLKPDNLLVMRDGAVRVSDLGTARRLEPAEPAIRAGYAAPPGHIDYAAPELVATLHDVDPKIALRADFYSLGAVLLEMFTGQVLGSHLSLNPSFLPGLLAIRHVDRAKRVAFYNGLLPEIASQPLPNFSDFQNSVPPSVRSRVEHLYRSLAALDYRRRLVSFPSVFRQIDMAIKVMDNEAAYRGWRAERRKRRIASLAKRTMGGIRPAESPTMQTPR